MQLIMLKSKIYNIKVTDADIRCDGSIAIDSDLMLSSGIKPYEQVHVLNITNSNRFITYAIEGDTGEIKVLGAAAKLVNIGDSLIILAYAMFDDTTDCFGRGYPKKVDGKMNEI
jgi:aspartate 1-decarboxylase